MVGVALREIGNALRRHTPGDVLAAVTLALCLGQYAVTGMFPGVPGVA